MKLRKATIVNLPKFRRDAVYLTMPFGAYVSSFGGSDDDDGDGMPDLLAVPQWMSYELKELSPQVDGSFKEPDISIKRPDDRCLKR